MLQSHSFSNALVGTLQTQPQMANTQQKATTTEPPEDVDEPEPLEVEVVRNPFDGKQVATDEETTVEPPKGTDELQVEFRNPAPAADQPKPQKAGKIRAYYIRLIYDHTTLTSFPKEGNNVAIITS